MWNLVGAALVAALPGANNLPNTKSSLSLWAMGGGEGVPLEGKGSKPSPNAIRGRG